jgi:hypothetical protein
MRFGLRIPSFAWRDLTHQDAAELGDYCRQVDSLPFEDIWVIDHLLEAPAVYGVSWLDPLTALTFAAGVTERVGLGTAALILPCGIPFSSPRRSRHSTFSPRVDSSWALRGVGIPKSLKSWVFRRVNAAPGRTRPSTS